MLFQVLTYAIAMTYKILTGLHHEVWVRPTPTVFKSELGLGMYQKNGVHGSYGPTNYEPPTDFSAF